MNKIFLSFITSEFLKSFVAKKESFNIEDNENILEIWRNLLKFFRKKTKIYLYIEKVTKDDLTYNFDFILLREILNNAVYENNHIEISRENLYFLITKIPIFSSLDFVFENESEINKSVATKYGINYFNSENFLQLWSKFSQIYTICIPARDSNQTFIKGWYDFELPKYSFNSMIICDNYLFSRKSNILNNFIPLIKSLLLETPKDIDFDLTIFTSKFYTCENYISINNEKLNIVYNDIKKAIKDKLKIKNLNLTLIYKKLNEYHDRHIITNTFILKSGNSFSYFGDNCQLILPNETTIDILPLTLDYNNKTYFEIYKPIFNRLKKILESSNTFIGSKSNRLFNKFLN